MASEVLQHTDPGPAALFNKISGYPQGYKVLVNFFGGQRKNMPLGFPRELSRVELPNEIHQALQTEKPTPYQVIEGGPVMENVRMGDDVKILYFPAPKWYEKEGGRYIETGCFTISVDSEDGWVNVGTYRFMVHMDAAIIQPDSLETQTLREFPGGPE